MLPEPREPRNGPARNRSRAKLRDLKVTGGIQVGRQIPIRPRDYLPHSVPPPSWSQNVSPITPTYLHILCSRVARSIGRCFCLPPQLCLALGLSQLTRVIWTLARFASSFRTFTDAPFHTLAKSLHPSMNDFWNVVAERGPLKGTTVRRRPTLV